MDQKLAISALVAMVALVGLVVLMQGQATGGVMYVGGNTVPDRGVPGEFTQDNLVANTHCAFVGHDVCPSGYLCRDVANGEDYCQ